MLIAAVATAFYAKPVHAQRNNDNVVKQNFQFIPHYTITAAAGHLIDTSANKAMYLQKSRNQRTAGWILLGGGALMAVSGGVLFSNNFELFSSKNDDKAATGGVLFLTGLGCSLGSIPFFISAAHNANKAATVSFNRQPIVLPQQNNLVVKMQPGISVKIRL